MKSQVRWAAKAHLAFFYVAGGQGEFQQEAQRFAAMVSLFGIHVSQTDIRVSASMVDEVGEGGHQGKEDEPCGNG